MSSAAEAIVTEIIALLTVPALVSVPAARVFRDPMEARQSSELPTIAVETGNEDAPERVTLGLHHRQLEVRVSIFAKGSAPYQQADAALVESAARLLEAPIVNGLRLNGLAVDLLEGPTRRERDGLAQDLAEIAKSYVVVYRTREDSLEALA